MTTQDNLVQAAAALLNAGGEAAVTLRGVAQATGLSHNAPYKHFRNREALLAAVATADLRALTSSFAAVRTTDRSPTDKLFAAIGVLVEFSRERPSRYRLVFGASTFSGDHRELHDQNSACLAEFTAMVDECKSAGLLPDAPTKSLASLILAAMHGLVLLEANDQLRPEKGLPTVEQNMRLMIDLLAGRHADGQRQVPTYVTSSGDRLAIGLDE